MSLTFTPPAIDKLKTELERKRNHSEQVFRLLVDSSGGFRLRLDAVTPEDIVVHHEGMPVLAVQPALAELLSDAALDVGQGDDEPEWVLVRGGTPA
jgi:Fe-S cluster assembly iron-binding protein IscA